MAYHYVERQENTVTTRWGIFYEYDVLIEGGFSTFDAAEDYMFENYFDPSDYQDDGQPSELTEWMDFDPDC